MAGFYHGNRAEVEVARAAAVPQAAQVAVGQEARRRPIPLRLIQRQPTPKVRDSHRSPSLPLQEAGRSIHRRASPSLPLEEEQGALVAQEVDNVTTSQC